MNGENLPQDCYSSLNASQTFKQLKNIDILLTDFCQRINLSCF